MVGGIIRGVCAMTMTVCCHCGLDVGMVANGFA